MRQLSIIGMLALASVMSACADSNGSDPSGAGAASSGGGANSTGGTGGGGGGPPCSIDPAGDPSAVVRALVVQGGTVVEAPAPTPTGGHPSVDNGGCTQAEVKRGESIVVPFAFGDTDTPVGGCIVTVEGATNYIELGLDVCDGGLELVGELPFEITVPEQMCAGSFSLRYAARADAPAVSQYLSTAIQVTDEIAEGGAPELCQPPEPEALAGITAAHNAMRDGKAPPLLWDDALAAIAQARAESLAAQGCTVQLSEGPYGENVVAALNGSFTVQDVIIAWWGSSACFTNGPYPGCCDGCYCGDYTQMIWAGTSTLGCGKAECTDGEVWVCNYDPPGNQEGQSPY